MAISLTQLEAFLTAARCSTFTSAAAELRMSQPAISDLVRRLESEVGAPLFVRGSRGLELTAAGQQLLPHAERAIDSVRAGSAAVRALTEISGGTATFGVLRNAAYYLKEGLVRRFHERYPQVRIRLVGQNSAETADDIRAGRLEAGLVALPVGGDAELDVLPLVRDEVVYVSANASHVTSPPRTADICARPMVLYDAHHAMTDPMRRQLSERAQLDGVRLEPVMEVEYLAPALDLVAAGFGDSLIPRGAIRTEVVPRRLHVSSLAEPLFDTVALVRRRGHYISPATAEFARLAHDALVANSRLPDATAELLRVPMSIEEFLG
jgi:DNA-binding transcriptional LysR family regulator